MGREDMETELYRTETILVIEILAEEIPTAVSKETEFDCLDEIYQNSVFDYFGRTSLRYKVPNALVSNQLTF